MDNITNLGGHSGCSIMLHEMDNGDVFVRKTSSGSDYNERLKCQMEKQKMFSNKIIKTPKVYQSGFDENELFYFDMEYVQGITLARYVMSIEINKIRQIVKMIYDGIIDSHSQSQPQNDGDYKAFQDKISSLSNSVDPEVFSDALEILNGHNWKAFPSSRCHGDLTLENIIIKGDQVYVIDFLDSFFDSWIIDIGTLLQDVQTLWAYRNMNCIDINAKIRLIVFRDVLMDGLKESSPHFIIEAYYALLLKLLRIVPYADDKTLRFLAVKIHEVIDMIKEGEFA